jgi:hypothetical protein
MKTKELKVYLLWNWQAESKLPIPVPAEWLSQNDQLISNMRGSVGHFVNGQSLDSYLYLKKVNLIYHLLMLL